jgi:hypothetical protein
MSLFKYPEYITYQPFKTLPAVLKKNKKKAKKKAVQLNGSKQQIIIP